MSEEVLDPKASTDEAVLNAQYLRSLSSFEGIILAQIQVKEQLSNRLNWTIRAGLILLGVIALSILILLLTLSSQINRISNVVVDINQHFESITVRMDAVSSAMGSMEQQVALLEPIQDSTGLMDKEMLRIGGNVRSMTGDVDGVRGELTLVRDQISAISRTLADMNAEVAMMAREMHYMAKPARSINRMFPLP